MEETLKTVPSVVLPPIGVVPKKAVGSQQQRRLRTIAFTQSHRERMK